MNTLQRFHTKECPYLCLLCFKSFHSLRLLKQHFDRHEQEAKNEVTGVNVSDDKEMDHDENRETNMYVETSVSKSDSENPFGALVCDICGKMFKFRYLLFRHSLNHKPKGLYQCDSCDNKFSSKREYLKHIKNHNNISLRKFLVIRRLCDICGKCFGNDRILKWHKQFHLPPGNFPCKLCDKVFDLNAKLKVHMEYHRTKVRDMKKLMKQETYPCEVCGKVFNLTKALRNHRRLHTESYECHLCRKVFNKKENLKTHMYIHQGKKPHSCSHCGASYADRSNLKKHLLKHPPDAGARMISMSVF